MIQEVKPEEKKEFVKNNARGIFQQNDKEVARALNS